LHLPARRSRQNATFILYQALSSVARFFLRPLQQIGLRVARLDGGQSVKTVNLRI
jgi:hypothetical protein